MRDFVSRRATAPACVEPDSWRETPGGSAACLWLTALQTDCSEGPWRWAGRRTQASSVLSLRRGGLFSLADAQQPLLFHGSQPRPG